MIDQSIAKLHLQLHSSTTNVCIKTLWVHAIVTALNVCEGMHMSVRESAGVCVYKCMFMYAHVYACVCLYRGACMCVGLCLKSLWIKSH